MTIHLETLSGCPRMLPKVARALWGEFQTTYLPYFPCHCAEDLEAYLKAMHINPEFDPTLSLVVHNGADILIGFCDIVADDLGSPWNQSITYTPWLANVYVAPEFRSQGVGDIMLTYMRKNVFPSLGVPVFLWTHTPQLRDWYQRRHGFVPIQTVKHYAHHPEIFIMKYDATA